MRVVAILAVRNERPYLLNCLSHLVENGIDFAVVDNDSTDGCKELIHSRQFAPHLAGYCHVPFDGTFRWRNLLLVQEQLMRTIDAEWQLLVAPDEIMHSYVPGETLLAAIERLDRQGFNVINFEEFVFLPVDGDYIPDHEGMQPLRYYYLHAPAPHRLMRAWRKALNVSNVEDGSHLLTGSDYRLAPENLALRHYIVRNQAHALEKYTTRAFSADEIRRKWHLNRIGFPAASFLFPPADELLCLAAPSDRNLQRDRPWPRHYWER